MEDDLKPISPETSGLSAFWRELRRRKVVRVAVVYAVVAWLLIQVSATVFPQVGLPDWTSVFVTWILIIGFPIALIIAWAFEVTPEEVKAGSEDQTGGSVAPNKGNRLNNVILGFIALALVFLIVDRYLFDAPPSSKTDKQGSPPASSSSSGVKRSVINLDDDQMLALAELAPHGLERRSITISPDGSHLAYIVDIGGVSKLFLRRMDEFESHPLEGTEGAFGLFFSPDGQWIGFLTPTQVMKVSIRGGTPQSLAEAVNVYGASWGPDDKIVFAERNGLQVSIVSAEGGEKQVLLSGNFHDPEFLPDGKGILLSDYSTYPKISIGLYLFETGKTTPLIDKGAAPFYVPTGHILYTSDGGISAIAFDISTYTVRGSSVPVLDDVRRNGRQGLSQIAYSVDGFVAYIPGSDVGLTNPVWVDRSGKEEEIPLPLQRYSTFQLSPDGSQVAFLTDSQSTDVWLFDFERATSPRRLTVGGNKTGVCWSPDGKTIAFGVGNAPGQTNEGGLFLQQIESSQAFPVLKSNARWFAPESWVTDDLIIFSESRNVSEAPDIWVVQLNKEVKPEPFVYTPNDEWGPSMSPDGRYVAYTSDESGQNQVYVKAYPPTETRWMISTDYGEEAVWSASGDEIFYRSGEEFLSVPVQTEPEFVADIPKVLFEGPYANISGISADPTPDSQRFFILKSPDQEPATKIHLITNWFEELNRLVPPSDD